MAECHHTACLNCWKSWLKRQNTCPTCRAPTTVKDLSKLVFARGTATGAPSLTQICANHPFYPLLLSLLCYLLQSAPIGRLLSTTFCLLICCMHPLPLCQPVRPAPRDFLVSLRALSWHPQ
mmetsp:Transcript_875/g.1955  ORF Transcript_875/g.1955 Transcript_875/m.1955 type:complete len:121 (+) Transcript_875:100-462(+)